MKKYLLLFVIALVSLASSNMKAHNPPIPAFSALGTCFGDSTKFINQSSGGVSQMWIIQKLDTILHDTLTLDTLYTVDIIYYFQNQGTYLVSLSEDNGHVVTITKQINIGTVTMADFDFQRCSNQFFNMSTCSSSFHWDFGDNTTSTVPFAQHQYADTGTYIVTLIAYNGLTSDTLTKNIHVTELGYPHPTFQVTVSNDTAYCKITGGIYSNLTWYFCDGSSANSPDTFFVFQDTGICSISVRVFNTCGMFMGDTMVTYNSVTSLKENSLLKQECFVYPNPAKNNIEIKILNDEAITYIEVFDILGRTKINQYQKLTNNFNIDISSLLAGQYLVQVQTTKRTYYKKFLKE